MGIELLMWLFGAVFGLIGVLFLLWWQHVQKCTERASEAAKVEEKVATLSVEVGTLRDRWHDLTAHVSQALAQWYTQIMEKVIKK